MATQITLSGGAFQDAQGNVLANGTLVLRLTSDAVTTDAVTQKQILGNIPITITLDSSGNVNGTPKIWSNAELSPSGTGYSVIAFSASGLPSWKTSQTWVFNQVGGSTVDLGTMVPTSSGASYSSVAVLSGNNVLTGQNSLTAYNINNILFVDGQKYATIDAAIAALAGAPGFVVVPSTYAGGNATLPYSNLATVLDLRGGSTQVPARTDSFTAGDYVAFNSQVEGSIAGFAVQHGRTSPALTSSAILATSKFTGTLPNANTLAGLTAEVDIVGAVTPGTGVPCAIEAYTAIRSNGGTLLDVRGLTASVNLDLAGSTTNITSATSLFASPPVNTSGTASIVNAYSLQASQPTAGTTLNYAFFCNGSMLISNNVNIDSLTAGGIIKHIMTFGAGDLVQFRPLNDANGFQFADQAGTQRVVINSTGLGIIASPSFKLHVEGSTAGDILAKFKNTSGTGFGVKFVPGADTNYGIAVSNAADNANNFTVLGSGKVATYAGLTTAGQGVSPIVAVTSQKAETAADASVLSFTPPAVAGSYRISFVLSLSAANAATLGWTATWKDSNGNAQAPTNLALTQSGVAAPALTFTTSAAGNYSGSMVIDTDGSATAIVIKLTFTGTSFAGKATATIEKVI